MESPGRLCAPGWGVVAPLLSEVMDGGCGVLLLSARKQSPSGNRWCGMFLTRS